MSPEIHATAIVHPGADIGQDVVIGPYCIIEEDVRIGDRTRLDSFVQIKNGTTIGTDNRIYSYTNIGDDPQHLVHPGKDCEVVIGDHNTIREYVTVHRGTEGFDRITRIGSHCMLMAYVHIAHDCILGDHVIFANSVMLAGHVIIGNHATIGGITGVHQFTRIGDYAFLGATSGLNQDLPPYMLAGGYRASLQGLNLIGLRRHRFSREAIAALKKAYAIIWRSELPRKEAIAEVESHFGEFPEIQNLLDFIRNSARGISSARVKEGN